MRNQLLCALAILCGAEGANAQMSPTYSTNGYYQGYGAGYQVTPGAYGYNGYSQYARPTSYAPYYQGYGQSYGQIYGQRYGQGYGNYPSSYYYPNYTARNQNYYYQMSYPRNYAYPQNTAPAATPPVATVSANVVQEPVTPVVESHPGQDPPMLETASATPPEPPCRERVWTNAEYDMSYIRPQRLNDPLVTTGSITDINTGALGQPGTGILFGNKIDFGMFSGIRGMIGVYLDDADSFSVEAGGRYSFQNSVNFGKASDPTGVPVITRPIFNVVTATETAFLDAFPGISAGSVAVQAKSELWGAELDTSYHCQPCEHLHLEGLVGFRYLHLAESLTIQDQLMPLQDNVLTFDGPLGFVNAPSSLADEDEFRTVNNFYGFQLGGRAEWFDKWYSLGAFAKVGIGATDETVDIKGETSLFSPMGNQTTSGGILALPSNIGHYNRAIFSVVPEVGLNLAVNVCPHLQLTAGYSFLYWNQIVRPSAQIDHNINTSMVPTDVSFGQASGPAKPVFHFNDEAFWVQSLSFGFDLHY